MSANIVPVGLAAHGKRRPGRPTVLTFRVMRKVIRLLRQGHTLEYGAYQAGISRDAWERRATRDSRFGNMTTRARLRGIKMAIAMVIDRLHDIALNANARDRMDAARLFLAMTQRTQTHAEGKPETRPSLTRKDILEMLRPGKDAKTA